MNDILVVSDMGDLKAIRQDPKFVGMEFCFANRSATKFTGWIPDTIYVTRRAELLMGDEVEHAIKIKKGQGSKICPVN